VGQALVVSFLIIMSDEFIHGAAPGGFSEKAQAVDTLLADGADKPLGLGIQVWGAGRQTDCLAVGGAKPPAKWVREEGRPVVDQGALRTEKAVPGIGEMARDRLHPRGVGFRDDPCEFDLTGREANDEEHVTTNQSPGRPKFQGEAIGRGQYLPVSFEKLFPSQPLWALGRWCPSRGFHDLGHRAASDLLVQVGQRTLDSGVTPGPVLPGQFQDQFLELRPCGGRPGLRVRLESYFWGGDERPGPGQQSIRSDETGKLVQSSAADAFAFDGQPSSLIIIEPRFFTQLLFEDANFLWELGDDILRVAAHPTGDRNEEQGQRIHRQIIQGWKSDG